MRQIATAMVSYFQANKGRLPPAQIDAMPGAYPSGWWWPNELVRQNYIKAPSVYSKPGSTVNDKKWTTDIVFKCPSGIFEDYVSTPSAGGDYPTDAGNNGYSMGFLPSPPVLPVPNDVQCATDGFGIPSWYMLTSRNTSGSNALGSTKVTPFMYFNVNTPITLGDKGFQRNLSMIRRPAEMVMIAEATNPNFYDQTLSSKYPNVAGKRLGARHGKKTRDGANAYWNLAFFDGHVGLYPTEPYARLISSAEQSANLGASNDNALVTFWQGTIFYLNRQRGR